MKAPVVYRVGRAQGGPPADGERERARRWGESFAATAVAALHRI